MSMKSATLKTIALILLLAAVIFTVTREGATALPAAAALPLRQCPTISVTCPDMVGVEPVTYSAHVSGGLASRALAFSWTISAGRIISGQGTNSITVDPTEAGGRTVTATVEVGGLPNECGRRAECATAVLNCPVALKFGEYGALSVAEETERLDEFAAHLQDNPILRSVIIAYGGRRTRASEPLARANRARDYLVNVRGIDSERIKIEDGGFREQLTVELWVVPEGAEEPTPWPTIDPREVEIIPTPANRRSARQKP